MNLPDERKQEESSKAEIYIHHGKVFLQKFFLSKFSQNEINYAQSLGEDAEKDDIAAEYIARKLAAGSDDEEEEFHRPSMIRSLQLPTYSVSKVASLHTPAIQPKIQSLVRTASRQRSTTSSMKPFSVKPTSPPTARSGVSSKASSAIKSGSASKHIYKPAPTQPSPARPTGKILSSKASPASKSASTVRTKAYSQSSQTSKTLPQSLTKSTGTNKSGTEASARLDEAEKLQQQQEVREIEEISKETSTKTSNILSVS